MQITQKIYKICASTYTKLKTQKRKEYFSNNLNENKEGKKYKVVGVTPAGRRRYLEILIPNLLKQRPWLDEHIFWINTENTEDILYIEEMCQEYPDFFKFRKSKVKVNGNHSIAHFFEECVNADTIYVRFDDDICWLADNAVKELVQFRLKNPEYFIVFGNIINNAICNYLHQRFGKLDLNIGVKNNLSYDCLDPESWGSGKVASIIHEIFLTREKNNQADIYLFDKWILSNYERFSINFFAFFGADFAKFGGKVGEVNEQKIKKIEEEPWLSQFKPEQLKRPNCICGTALASHFSFFPQREYLESSTKILSDYKALALEY